MNARMLLFLSLMVCISLLVSSCTSLKGAGLGGAVPGSGNVQSETRAVASFEAIRIEYPADVTVQQGHADKVVIEAEDNLLRQLSSEVSSGRLTLKSLVTDWSGRVNPSKPVKVTITMRNPAEIEFSAPTGTLEANGLQAEKLRLVLSGAGQVTLNGLEVGLLDSVLSGAGDLRVAGTAAEVKLLLSGAGNFNGADLKSTVATIEISGMGDAILRVEAELAAKITGAGSVKDYGEPRVEQTVNGAGSVKPAE